MPDDDRDEVAESALAGAETATSTRSWIGVALALALAAAAGAAVWAAFVGVGPAVADSGALRESIEVRSPGLTDIAVVITTAGSTAAMAVLAVAVGIVLWLWRRRVDATFVILTMATASLVFTVIKDVLDRPRPPVASRLVTVTNESLPSGHATMSFTVIGCLVVLGWAGRSTAARIAMVAAAALWVGAVGATRVYLGVHWFSDVIAGWLLGAAWLAICTILWARWRAVGPSPSSRTKLS